VPVLTNSPVTSGNLQWATDAEGTNIYNSNGDLTGSRVVTGNQGRLLLVESFDTTNADFTERGELQISSSSSALAQLTGDGLGDDVREAIVQVDVSGGAPSLKIKNTLDEILEITQEGTAPLNITSEASNVNITSDTNAVSLTSGPVPNQAVFDVDASSLFPFAIVDNAQEMGATYGANYAANFISRSLPDVRFVRNRFVSLGANVAARNYITKDSHSWGYKTVPEANAWGGITWAEDLGIFCAVSADGTNRVMTSPDGSNWEAQTAASLDEWNDITWSSELGIFAAVATNAGSLGVQTSSDGISWTLSSTGTTGSWLGSRKLCPRYPITRPCDAISCSSEEHLKMR